MAYFLGRSKRAPVANTTRASFPNDSFPLYNFIILLKVFKSCVAKPELRIRFSEEKTGIKIFCKGQMQWYEKSVLWRRSWILGELSRLLKICLHLSSYSYPTREP